LYNTDQLQLTLNESAVMLTHNSIYAAQVNVGNGDGDLYIYSVLDWADPESAGITGALVVLLLLPVLHTLLYAWHSLGAACAGCCCGAPTSSSTDHRRSSNQSNASSSAVPNLQQPMLSDAHSRGSGASMSV
jgi:hypothetical protein